MPENDRPTCFSHNRNVRSHSTHAVRITLWCMYLYACFELSLCPCYPCSVPSFFLTLAILIWKGLSRFELIGFHQQWVHSRITCILFGLLCISCPSRLSRIISRISSLRPGGIVCSLAYMWVIFVFFNPFENSCHVFQQTWALPLFPWRATSYCPHAT